MTDDDIIRMAREAGDDVEHTLPSDLAFLARFAAVVREGCAEVCDHVAEDDFTDDADYDSGLIAGHRNCARRIRAHGTQSGKEGA